MRSSPAHLERPKAGNPKGKRSSSAHPARDSELKLRATLDALPGLMFLLTSDGTYLDYHATDPRDLLIPSDQFLGRNIRDVMPASLADRFLEALADASDQQRLTVVGYSLHIGGKARHYEARICPCGDDRVLGNRPRSHRATGH